MEEGVVNRDCRGDWCDGPHRRGWRPGQVGAAEREKWAGYVSVLKVEPTGLADGLGVK